MIFLRTLGRSHKEMPLGIHGRGSDIDNGREGERWGGTWAMFGSRKSCDHMCFLSLSLSFSLFLSLPLCFCICYLSLFFSLFSGVECRQRLLKCASMRDSFPTIGYLNGKFWPLMWADKLNRGRITNRHRQ